MEQVSEKVIERIKKLLALANNNPNEHEASSAMARATELLETYNLDMSVLGKSGKGAQRSDAKKTGGLYSWQRKLWQSVAELNFCHYFSLKGLSKGSVYEHRLVGSHANVIATEMMAKYLQDAIEKLAQRWAKENFYKSVFVREAIAYREGMAARIGERLQARRDEMVTTAKREAEERKRNEAHAAMPATGNALTIIDVISSEEEFNADYLNGWEMGTSARNRVERAAKQKAWEAAHAAKQRQFDEWAAKHPAEAAAMKAKLEAENKAWWEKYSFKQSRRVERQRRLTSEEKRMGLGSYREGLRAGNDVGIDTQVAAKAPARRIG